MTNYYEERREYLIDYQNKLRAENRERGESYMMVRCPNIPECKEAIKKLSKDLLEKMYNDRAMQKKAISNYRKSKKVNTSKKRFP